MGYVSLPTHHARFAAGLTKLLVVLPEARQIQRWDLRTLEREITAPLTLDGTVQAVSMGSASDGPLLVGGVGGPGSFNGLAFIDPHTLRVLDVSGRQAAGFGERSQIRAAAAGNVFTVGTRDGTHSLMLTGGRLVATAAGPGCPSGACRPSPDGRVVFGPEARDGPRGLFTPLLKHLSGPDFVEHRLFIPAAHGPFYLGVQVDTLSCLPEVFLIGDERPLLTLPRMGVGWGEHAAEVRDPIIPFDLRFHLIPEAKLLVTVPTTNDQLVLRRLDVDQALAQSDRNYLYVASLPPPEARRGSTYGYAPAVKSRAGGVQYKLEAGPEGMALAPDGRLEWPVPKDFQPPDTPVLLRIVDAGGREELHSFVIRVRD